jgi:hypothetical protein
MKKSLLVTLFVLSIISAIFTGCASTDSADSAGGIENQNVSNIPWNRPQKWEGGGALGGMAGAMQ